MRYKLSIRERGLNAAWKVISIPRIYRYARRFDINSIFAFRLSGPDGIMVEPTNNCNLRCIMCGRTYYPQPRGYMDFKMYRNFIDQVRVPLIICHLGFGEPLLHPNIVDMILYSARKGMRTNIITNGMLLTAEVSAELIRAGLSEIWISLDGARKETYERIRQGARFETVILNIGDMVKLRNELAKGKLDIGICTVPMSSNLKELPDLARMAREIGADRFEVQRFEKASKAEGECCTPVVSEEEDPYKPELKDELSSAFSALDEMRRLTCFPITRPPASGELLFRPPRRCPMPYTLPLITWEGYMMPCFCFGDPREINMGNLREKPFYVIWNDKPFRAFRDALLSNSPHPRCMRCRIFRGISQLWTDYKTI